MRLIDADHFIKQIEKNSYIVHYDYNSCEPGMAITGIQQAINEQPTVFDVEKIIAEFKEWLNDKETGDIERETLKNVIERIIKEWLLPGKSGE
jgi:ribulose kinase